MLKPSLRPIARRSGNVPRARYVGRLDQVPEIPASEREALQDVVEWYEANDQAYCLDELRRSRAVIEFAAGLAGGFVDGPE